MITLFNEIKTCLENRGLSLEDIRWVGSSDGAYAMSWEKCLKLEHMYEPYYEGFGAAEIALDLVVVGDDWWLVRYEYDGSEGFEFMQQPKVQGSSIGNAKKFTKLRAAESNPTKYPGLRSAGKLAVMQGKR